MLEQIYFSVWDKETSAVKPCLWALSTKGETLWKQCSVGNYSHSYINDWDLVPSGDICADELCKSNRRVLLVTETGKLHAFDSRKGTKLWDFSASCLLSRATPLNYRCGPHIAPDGKTVCEPLVWGHSRCVGCI